MTEETLQTVLKDALDGKFDMKLKAKWRYYNGEKYELEVVDASWCCEEAERSEAITFGEVGATLNTNEAVNISSCAPYPEGAVWDEEAIQFCPFCGTKITVEILR